MTKVYYNNATDYNNRNRFRDALEGNALNIEYNSFLSASSVDLYYKANGRLQTINFVMPDIIPLGAYEIDLKPSNNTTKIASSGSVVIEYNSTTNTSTITNV